MAALAVTMGALTACASPVPVAENFPMTTQKKVRAAQHWHIMADDIVSQTIHSLKENDYLNGRALYVQAEDGNHTPFDRAFRNFIVTDMVERGLPVSDKPDNAVTVLYETQIVKHNSDRPDYKPGLFTALTGGVMVARNVSNWSSGAQIAGALGTAAAVDVLAGKMASPTHNELIVTTSVVADNMFVMRKSDVYYVEDADVSLFDEAVTKEWKVVGQ